MAEKKAKYVQVGQLALRDPVTGEVVTDVPLYIEEDEMARRSEEYNIRQMGRRTAQVVAYMKGLKGAGVSL